MSVDMPQGYDFNTGALGDLEGSREPGGAGDVGGSTTAVEPTTPPGGYGRAFASRVEDDLGERGSRDGRPSLP